MKNLLALIWSLIFFASCSKTNAPENLIARNDMVNVLIDMHLADASLDFMGHGDSMLVYAKSKYNYLFQKHDIDSAAFSSSLKYYSNNSSEFTELYKSVIDSLSRINRPEIIKIYRTKRFIPDSLRFGTDKIKALQTDSLAKKTKALDSLSKPEIDSLNKVSNKNYALLDKKPKVNAIDSVKTKKNIKPLDNYLRKTDSLNTVKLLELGIDF